MTTIKNKGLHPHNDFLVLHLPFNFECVSPPQENHLF